MFQTTLTVVVPRLRCAGGSSSLLSYVTASFGFCAREIARCRAAVRGVRAPLRCLRSKTRGVYAALRAASCAAISSGCKGFSHELSPVRWLKK